MALSRPTAVMRLGRLQQQAGSPRELYLKPANRFVAQFLGSPPINFLQGRLQAQGEVWCFTERRERGRHSRGAR